jgi:UDP-2,3-diacylglucosamine pyrophosphatase LpxH
MIEHIIDESKYEYWAAIEDIIKVGEEFWFVTANYNGLFRLDNDTNKAVMEAEFVNQENVQRLYSNLVLHNGKIVCVPLNAKQIAIYDLKSKEIVMLPIREPRLDTSRYDGTILFFDTVSYKNYVILIGAKYPAVLRINMDTFEVEYFDEWVEMIEKNSKSGDAIYFRKNNVMIGNQLFVASIISPYVIQIDLDLMSFTPWLIMDGKYDLLSGITICGDKLYIVPAYNESIIEWDKERGIYKEFFLTNNHSINKAPTTFSVEALGKNVYVLSQSANDIYVYNTEQGTVIKLPVSGEKIIRDCVGYTRYGFTKKIGNVIYGYSNAFGRLVEIDDSGEISIKGEIIPDWLSSKQLAKKILEYKKIFTEGEDALLNEFIRLAEVNG